MLKRTFRKFVTLLAVIGVGSLVACTNSDDGSAEEKVLTYAANMGPTSLDPVLQSVDQFGNFYVNVAYETLTRIDENGEVVPALATSWEYTDESNTVLEFELREEARFSDGSPVTADAVVDSLEYSHTQGVNGPNWLGTVTEINALDEKTVQIKTSEPNDSLPSVLSQRMLLGSIISPDGLDDVDQLKNQTFGAGPYVLDPEETIAEDTYVYKPNQYYWDQSKIHWDKVVIKVAGNPSSALQAVENGQADYMNGDATTGNAAESAGLGVSTAEYGMTGINIMDREGAIVPALKEPKVRQALLYAIDRESLAQAAFPNFSIPGFSLVLDGFPGYSEEVDEAYSYDIDKARELMEEAGYADGFTVDIAAPTANKTNVMAQGVIEEWSKIGVDANLTTYTDLGQMTTDILAGNYPITAYNYGALPTPVQNASFFTGGQNQFNAFDTTDDELTDLLDAAAEAPTPEETDLGYQEALRKAQVENAWVSNTYVREQVAIYNQSTVDGFIMDTQNAIPDVQNIVPAE